MREGGKTGSGDRGPVPGEPGHGAEGSCGGRRVSRRDGLRSVATSPYPAVGFVHYAAHFLRLSGPDVIGPPFCAAPGKNRPHRGRRKGKRCAFLSMGSEKKMTDIPKIIMIKRLLKYAAVILIMGFCGVVMGDEYVIQAVGCDNPERRMVFEGDRWALLLDRRSGCDGRYAICGIDPTAYSVWSIPFFAPASHAHPIIRIAEFAVSVIGAVAEPWKVRRMARAQADAGRIEARCVAESMALIVEGIRKSQDSLGPDGLSIQASARYVRKENGLALESFEIHVDKDK